MEQLEGQMSIFDYIELQTCSTCASYCNAWNGSHVSSVFKACFSETSSNAGKFMEENDACEDWKINEEWKKGGEIYSSNPGAECS